MNKASTLYSNKLEQYIHRYSSRLNLDIKHRKEQFYLNAFGNNKGDTRGQCRVVNNLLGRGRDPIKIEGVRVGYGIVFSNPEHIANELTLHFCNIPDVLRAEIDMVSRARNDLYWENLREFREFSGNIQPSIKFFFFFYALCY